MMKVAAIDFETYYSKEYSVANTNTWAYMQDPQFNAYLMTVCGDAGEWCGDPKEFDWTQLDGCDWVMHNASFDLSVIYRLQELSIVPVSVKPRNVFDTADMAAFLKVRRNLATAAEYLLGKKVDKGVRDAMKGLTPHQMKEKGMWPAVVEYARRDASTTYELWTKWEQEWPESERELSRLNREACFAGVYADRDAADKAIETLTQQLWEAERTIPWADTEKILSPKAIREQGRKEGIPVPASLAMSDEGAMAWFEMYADKVPWVRGIRDYRRINSFLQKAKNFRAGIRGDGRYQYAVKYHGAATGRFSGGGSESGEGFNIQNLPRKTMFDVDFRSMLLPSPGYVLGIFDYAQIEARLLLWRAGDTKTLDLVRSGVSVYEAYAREKMGWTGGKLKDEDPDKYALCKGLVLGCGYGIGGTKFQKTALSLAGVILTLEQAHARVREYREANPLVTSFWREHQKFLELSANHGDATHEVVLVSGRTLTYFDIYREAPGENSRFGRGEIRGTFVRGEPRNSKKRMYGGILVENEIQAIARDLLCDSWRALAKAGYRVLFSVHDELVVELPVESAGNDAKDVERIMVTSSPWAKGLPIGVEYSLESCYCK